MSLKGSVANTSEESWVDAEQLVEEVKFTSNARLEQDALPFADHAHCFRCLSMFQCGVSGPASLEAEHGPDPAFDGKRQTNLLITHKVSLPLGTRVRCP